MTTVTRYVVEKDQQFYADGIEYTEFDDPFLYDLTSAKLYKTFSGAENRLKTLRSKFPTVSLAVSRVEVTLLVVGSPIVTYRPYSTNG